MNGFSTGFIKNVEYYLNGKNKILKQMSLTGK
jgi:hypothetical protein